MLIYSGYATTIQGALVQWQCPRCQSPNTDDYTDDHTPSCQTCEAEADWENILSPVQSGKLEALYPSNLPQSPLPGDVPLPLVGFWGTYTLQ